MQIEIEPTDADLDAAIARARTTPDEVYDALLGLIGLVQSITAVMPLDARKEILEDACYINAREVAKAYL